MAHPPSPSDPGPERPVGHDPEALLAELRPPPAVTLADRLDALRRRTSAPGTGAVAARAAAVAVVLAVAAGAGWWLLRPPAPPLEATLPRAGAEPGAAVGGPAAVPGGGAAGGAAGGSSTTAPAELVVQAAGAVARPGVYRLGAGGRVDDVVRAAGGPAPDADLDRVNLAAPVADGERVWVPRRGEAEPPEVVAGGAPPSPGPGPGPAGGAPGAAGAPAPPAVVDLNTADAAALDTLPGVGPATAAAILAHRDEHGPFGAVDELLEVRGIGEAKLEQLRPLVTV